MIASVVSGVGGGLIGLPMGTAIAGGKANWTLAGIGAVLIATSVPIVMSSVRQADRAVEIYNGGIVESSFWDDKELKIGLTGNGVGLALTF